MTGQAQYCNDIAPSMCSQTLREPRSPTGGCRAPVSLESIDIGIGKADTAGGTKPAEEDPLNCAFELSSAEMHLDFVLSPKPHAMIKKIDYSQAEKIPGYVGKIDFWDLEHHHTVGPVVADDPIFPVDGLVHHLGQVVCCIVANDRMVARACATAVVVEWEQEFPFVISIEEAIAKKSFHNVLFTGNSQDVDVQIFTMRREGENCGREEGVGLVADKNHKGGALQGTTTHGDEDGGKQEGEHQRGRKKSWGFSACFGDAGGTKRCKAVSSPSSSATGGAPVAHSAPPDVGTNPPDGCAPAWSAPAEGSSPSQGGGVFSADAFFVVDSLADPLAFSRKVAAAPDALVEAHPDGGANVVTSIGEIYMGSQEHFYFETHAARAEFRDNDIFVTTSNQGLAETQHFISHATGIPCHKVHCKAVRLGGGFGGKETRAGLFAIYPVLAGLKYRRNCRFHMERDTDFKCSGARHSFVGQYKIAINERTLKIEAVDVRLFANAGCSHDLSNPVLNRAMLHVENCCDFKNARVRGSLCRTHIPSNTAFRGFGGPQGLFVAEKMLDIAGASVNKSREEVLFANLYRRGQLTFYNHPIGDYHCPIRAMCEEVQHKADFLVRKKFTQEFNAKTRSRKRGIALVPTKYGISFTAKHLNQAGAQVLLHML